MSKHHPTGLFHIKRGNWAKEFVKTCKALGMTDAEIIEAIRKATEESKATVETKENK